MYCILLILMQILTPVRDWSGNRGGVTNRDWGGN
jgi:hypothetical protein